MTTKRYQQKDQSTRDQIKQVSLVALDSVERCYEYFISIQDLKFP